MVRPVGAWLGSLASVLGLVLVLLPAGGRVSVGQAVAVTGLSCLFMLALGYDLWDHWKARPRKFRTQESINRYLYKWIQRGGRVVVFTRDMSWAHGERMKHLLVNKAKCSELTICLPRQIPLSQELAGAGAVVHTYDGMDHIPESRFTIANDGRMDARIAIGREIGGVHVIEEFRKGEHPVFAVAEDLTAIIRKASP